MKILIPVDGSESALWTIKQAAVLLDKAIAEIYLFLVVVPMPAELPWSFYAIDEEAGANEALRKADDEARNLGLKVARVEHQTFHEPASAICNYAKEQGIDLIIIGSHGYQGLAKFLMGSVSERVFKQAEQPVIIIRNDQEHTVEISHFEQATLKQAF